MSRTPFRRLAATACLALLASCASGPPPEDPRGWANNPHVEALKFYASGQSVPDYAAAKQDRNAFRIITLCWGLMDAGDESNSKLCVETYKRRVGAMLSSDRARAMHKADMDWDLEFIGVHLHVFLLEQGRFKEAEANLMPYLEREGTRMTFSADKVRNHHLRMAAAPILARAQRNLGGVTPAVRQALEQWAGETDNVFRSDRERNYRLAEREYLLGKPEACYAKVARSARLSDHSLTETLMSLGSAEVGREYERITFLRLQGVCAFEAGQLDDARATYQELLGIEVVRTMRGLQRLAHSHLAQIALRQGRPDEAVTHLRAAIDALEAERAAIDSEAGRLGYVTNKAEMYAQLVDLLVARGRDAEAFEYAERGKARALVDMLASKRGGAKVGPAGVYTRALQAVDEADAAAGPPGLTRGAALSRSVAVRQEIARSNPQLGSLLSVSALPAADVQKHLKPGETLVEYFGEGDRLFAFVVTQKGVKAVRLDGKAVTQHARGYRTMLTERTSRDHLAASKRLYDAAFAPVLPHVDGGALTVVPHGTLHYVPFASLHDGRGYLVQKSDVRLLPSASVLPFLTARANAGNGLLIMGNPDLGDPKLDLAGAEQEARALERINRGSQVLLRRNASETAFRKAGQQFREIHLAMHGKFDSQNAMASGLYMARDAENDGILSVGELYDMQLNADLVVLSACETALGDVSHGDDMVGLNRGFLFAGARSIVSSLWEVDDIATRDLMVAFYQQRAQHGKAGGLRQAQLAVMKKYPHPYYWAAFQMSGLF